jgi:hypothetical protein
VPIDERSFAPPSRHRPARRPALLGSSGEAEVLRSAARNAEDAGDFDGALRLVRRLPDGARQRRWSRDLQEVVQCSAMTSADIARWLVHPALRWAQERPTGRDLLERHAWLMLTTLGLLAPARTARLAAVAASDPVVIDAGLFDGGLFGRYLSEAAGPALLSRAGPVHTWERQPASIWRVEQQGMSAVVLHDLWACDDVRALPWDGVPSVATLLYGRLMPVSDAGPLAFALPPVPVDQRCAARILRARRRGSGADERLRAVALSRRRAAARAGVSG